MHWNLIFWQILSIITDCCHSKYWFSPGPALLWWSAGQSVATLTVLPPGPGSGDWHQRRHRGEISSHYQMSGHYLLLWHYIHLTIEVQHTQVHWHCSILIVKYLPVARARAELTRKPDWAVLCAASSESELWIWPAGNTGSFLLIRASPVLCLLIKWIRCHDWVRHRLHLFKKYEY